MTDNQITSTNEVLRWLLTTVVVFVVIIPPVFCFGWWGVLLALVAHTAIVTHVALSERKGYRQAIEDRRLTKREDNTDD